MAKAADKRSKDPAPGRGRLNRSLLHMCPGAHRYEPMQGVPNRWRCVHCGGVVGTRLATEYMDAFTKGYALGFVRGPGGASKAQTPKGPEERSPGPAGP